METSAVWSFFSSLITGVSIDGDFSELGNGVRRVKKFIRFWVLYRSRIALTSVLVGGVDIWGVVLARVRVAVVVVGFDGSFEGGNLDLDAFLDGVTDRLEVGFDTVWVLVKRWVTDDVEELALLVDDGLIERLRSARDDPCVGCNPEVAGRGIKPKRVGAGFWEVGGSGARFVIDIDWLIPVISEWESL